MARKGNDFLKKEIPGPALRDQSATVEVSINIGVSVTSKLAMYGTKQESLKNYDDDISEALCAKSEKDIENWMRSTLNMALRLQSHPDPSKPDPAYLIGKLTRRAEQMEHHLKLRKTILKKTQPTGTGNGLEMLMQQARTTATSRSDGLTGSPTTSPTLRDQLWQPDVVIRTPPPHLRVETAGLDELIRQEGKLTIEHVDSDAEDKFIINEDGV